MRCPMRWECSECGDVIRVHRPPRVCKECGIAGAIFVEPDDADDTADDRRAAWLRVGLERRALVRAHAAAS